MRCVYCQNRKLSWRCEGAPVDAERFAAMMLEPQGRGKRAAVVLSGSNLDAPLFRSILGGETPALRRAA